jgi:hypothetical protein
MVEKTQNLEKDDYNMEEDFNRTQSPRKITFTMTII